MDHRKTLVYDRAADNNELCVDDRILVYDRCKTIAKKAEDYMKYLDPWALENKMEPLHRLVTETRHLEKCRDLLERGANVNAVDIQNNTPLFFASLFANTEIIQLLLSYGAIVNHRNDMGETALLLCCGNQNADKKCVESLLDAGATVSTADDLGRTPLMAAAGYGNLEVMKTLLQRGCDINMTDVYGNTALFYTLMGNQYLEKFKLLISYDCNIRIVNRRGQSILHFACDRCHAHADSNMLEIIRYLLDEGIKSDVPDSSGDSCLHNGLVYSNPRFTTFNNPFLFFLLKGCYSVNTINSKGNSPLHVAVRDSGKRVLQFNVETLIKHGANVLQVNNFGWTPMFYINQLAQNFVPGTCHEKCSRDDFEKLLGILISHGDYINRKDYDGFTMLHYAFLYGNWFSELIPTLAEQGLDVNSGEGEAPTPLHVAMDLDFVPHRDFSDFSRGLAQLIRSADLHINAKDGNEATPLHWAAWHGSETLISLLMENGADEKMKDSCGNTPIDILYEFNHLHLLKLFSKDEISQKKGLPHLKVDVKQQKVFCYTDRDTKVDAQRFLEVAVDTPGLGKVCDTDEPTEVKHEVLELIKDLQTEVSKEDSIFKINVQLAGSVADKTKCGLPDEFDFLVSLERISNVCSVIENGSKPGYVSIVLKEDYWDDIELKQYFDKNHQLMKIVLVNKVYDIIRTCIQKKHILPRKHLKLLKILDDFPQPGPSLNIRLKWLGECYKDMLISIDFVPILRPSVYWWPSSSERKKKLLPEKSQQMGCDILLLKTRADDVSDFKVSFSCLECHILQNVTAEQHRGFLMAKTMRNLKVFSIGNNSNVSECVPVGCERIVDFTILEDLSSYSLKLAFLIVLEEIENNDNLKSLTAVDICGRIFDVLIKSCGSNDEEMHLPLYFLPVVNYWQDQSALTVACWEDFLNTLTFARDFFCKRS